MGCLNGLTEYIYTSSLKSDDQYCKKVYDCVKVVAQKHKELRVAPKGKISHGWNFIIPAFYAFLKPVKSL